MTGERDVNDRHISIPNEIVRLTIVHGERVRTLFTAFEGFTHFGRKSAASMSRNSPSESLTLW